MALGTAPKLNIKEEKARLIKLSRDSKARIEAEIKRYKSAMQNLRVLLREYDSCYTKYVAKPNTKTEDKLNEVTERLKTSNSIRLALEERIVTLMDIVAGSTGELIAILGEETPAAKNEQKNLDKYNEDISRRLNQIEGGITDALPDALRPKTTYNPEPELECEEACEPILESEDDASVSAPTAPVASNAPAAQAASSVKVAPVSIDVTPMVERAIAAAIAQMSDGLNARIDAYMRDVKLPGASLSSPATQATGVNAELEAHVLEGEREVYEKLRTMCETLDTLIAGVAEASSTYIALTQKVKEITDLQRQVNEMQRQTARDQQGVEVSQRLIQDGQAELIAGQKTIEARQAELADTAQKIIESQEAVLQAESAISKQQTEIEASMRAFVERSRAIATAQAQLEDAAAKVEATQRQIQERQRELVGMQKETLTEQRQLQREQKSVSERQAEIASPKAPKRTKKKGTDETPAETPVGEDSQDTPSEA